MKLLVCYESNCGGETIATEHIIQELKKLKVEVIAEKIAPLTRTDFVGFFSWILASIYLWTKIIWKNSQTNYIYTTTYTAGIATIINSQFRKRMLIWHYHGNRVPTPAQGLKYKSYFTQLLKYNFVNQLHQLLIKAAGLIIVPSKSSEVKLKKEFPLIDKRKICVVPNGVDKKIFAITSKKMQLQIRNSYGLGPKEKTLLYVGRINPQKRIEKLLYVTHLLAKRVKSLRLIIAHPKPNGDTENKYKQTLESLITKYDLLDNIIWLEEPNRIQNVYQLADITISLSVEEHFPLVLLEALAAGKLHMSTSHGAIKEILTSIDNRLIISATTTRDISGQILQIMRLSNHSKRNLTNKSRKLAELYSWRKTTRTLLMYLKLFQSKISNDWKKRGLGKIQRQNISNP